MVGLLARSLLTILATFELDNTTQYLELVMLLCSSFVERKRGGEEETRRSSFTNRRLRAFIYNEKRNEYGRKKYSGLLAASFYATCKTKKKKTEKKGREKEEGEGRE